jgi:hypothetical protein
MRVRRGFRLSVHMASVVPESDHWPGELVFVAQGTEARCAQHEISAIRRRFEPKPARRQYTHEMPACENQHVSLNRT